MKVKNILTVLAVLVATFIYPDVTLWLVPLVVSIATIIKFGRNDVAKYIGLLSLKPVVMFFLFLMAANFNLLERIYALSSYTIGSAIFRIVPELTLTLVIVYAFRHLFNNDRVVWLFLIGDIIRWLSLFIESLLPDPIPEPYFYTQFYVWVFFLLVFPALYAAVGFLSARDHVSRENATHNGNQPHPPREVSQ